MSQTLNSKNIKTCKRVINDKTHLSDEKNLIMHNLNMDSLYIFLLSQDLDPNLLYYHKKYDH